MRADRLLSILLLLQVHRRLTTRALAERLEVSARTVHRDMDALSAAGVPVYAERGAYGGWVLTDAFRTDLTGLTEAEAQAVFLAAPPRLLADLGLSGAAHTALIKLLASLPALARRDAEYVRQRIHVDGAGWGRRDEPVPSLGALQDAIWRERRVRLVYRRGDGEAVEREVDPLGLVAKGSLWYLVAAVDGEIRSYRVSRVQAATVLESACARPADFDLAAHWAASTAAFVAQLPQYPVTARVAPEALGRLWVPGSYARVEHVGEPAPDGWRIVQLVLQTLDEACSYALGFGPRLEILAPAELRARVIATARETVAFYAQADAAPIHDNTLLAPTLS